MSFRFRKKTSIIPGLYVHISKTGINTAIGPRLTGVNIRSGIPGMDVSVRKHFFFDRTKTVNIEISNDGLACIRTALTDSRTEMLEILAKAQEVSTCLRNLKRKHRNLGSWLGRIFASPDAIARLDRQVEEQQAQVDELSHQFEKARVVIDMHSDPEVAEVFLRVREAYLLLLETSQTWDASAVSTKERKEVNFTFGDPDFLYTELRPFLFENPDGSDIYIFPAFVVQVTNARTIKVVDYADLTFSFIKSPTELADRVGTFEFTFPGHTKTRYLLSNVSSAENFASALENYLAYFKKKTE